MGLTALDLFCGAGGATLGLQRAGYRVTGIDLNKQPRYCGDSFIRADILNLTAHDLRGFDLIWASPPCQAHSDMKSAPNAKAHKDLIPFTRNLLNKTGTQWVIENVEGAPLVNPVTLCGSMFNLKAGQHQLRRHRLFESTFTIEARACEHTTPVIGIYGGHVRCRAASHNGRRTRDFEGLNKRDLASRALGIEHMTLTEMSQAIPPAYSEHIGRCATMDRDRQKRAA